MTNIIYLADRKPTPDTLYVVGTTCRGSRLPPPSPRRLTIDHYLDSINRLMTELRELAATEDSNNEVYNLY